MDSLKSYATGLGGVSVEPAPARRVAMKMGRRLRCSSVTSRTIFTLLLIWVSLASVKMVRDAPSHRQSGSDRLADGPF
jgi:hypothetical protein